MSIRPSRSEGHSSSDSTLLLALLRRELVAIPLEHWGYFFPAQVAAWRFLEARRPGFLGQLDAGFSSEPYFKGKGADWFCGILGQEDRYLTLLEEIFYPLVDELRPRLADLDSVREEDLPSIEPTKVEELAKVILQTADAAIGSQREGSSWGGVDRGPV